MTRRRRACARTAAAGRFGRATAPRPQADGCRRRQRHGELGARDSVVALRRRMGRTAAQRAVERERAVFAYVTRSHAKPAPPAALRACCGRRRASRRARAAGDELRSCAAAACRPSATPAAARPGSLRAPARGRAAGRRSRRRARTSHRRTEATGAEPRADRRLRQALLGELDRRRADVDAGGGREGARSSAQRRKPPVPQPASRSRWPGRVSRSPSSAAVIESMPRYHQWRSSLSRMRW